MSRDDEAAVRPLDRTTIARMFRYTRPYAKQRNLLLLLVVVRAVQLPAIVWVIASIIGGPIARRDMTGLLLGVAWLVALLIFTAIVFCYRMRLALQLGEAVVFDMRREIFDHLLRMPMDFFTKMPLGRLISRVTSDIDVVRIGIQDVVFVSTVQLGSMLVAAVLMLYYDWLLFLLVLLLAPLLGYVIQRFRTRLAQAHRDVQETYSRLTTVLAESVNGIRVIQSFVRQEVNNHRFAKLMDVHSRNNLNAAVLSAIFVPLLEVNGQFFLSLVIVIGGSLALGGSLEIDVLIQFLFLSNLFLNPIPVLGRQYNQALTAMAGAERVFSLLDTKPEWTDPPTAVDIPQLRGRVEFRGVELSYEPGKPVLYDIDFTVEPGQTVALVGETGSGKSSIAKLLAKLYLPTKGTILIDGIDLREVKSSSLHAHLRIVPQDNYLFSGTVLDNVRFSRPSATEREISEVARRLDVLDLIEELPQGLLTEVGEKGASLSQGQRQLVCFVRALLADPRLLILDEATSSVDAITEARMQAALRQLLQGRTSFVVAHRLSTIRQADLILVMDQGRIVESGTHRELLRLGGHYAALYEAFVNGGEPASSPHASLAPLPSA